MAKTMNGEKKSGKYNEQLGLWENDDGTVNVPSSNFPIPLFLEWNVHCVSRHKNCRWEKMISDHEKARAYESLLEQKVMGAGIPFRDEGELIAPVDYDKVPLPQLDAKEDKKSKLFR